MKSSNTYVNLLKRENQVAVLIDPDKGSTETELDDLLRRIRFSKVDFIFVGGSTVSKEDFNRCIAYVKSKSKIPVIIFPGGSHQISEEGDALLYLSLISGRNPDFLIGHHVASANEVYEMDIEVIPTGYILIDGGTNSSVAYVSQTTPIPASNSSIILNTAKAGILQGKKVIYLDAGSGAKKSVPLNVIEKLAHLQTPLIIGGGITSIDEISAMHEAGANVVVIGNKIEAEVEFLLDIEAYKRSL